MLIYAGQPGRNDWEYKVNPLFVNLTGNKDYAPGLGVIGDHAKDGPEKVYFLQDLTLGSMGLDIGVGNPENRQIVGNSELISNFFFYKWAIAHDVNGKVDNYTVYVNREGVVTEYSWSWGGESYYPWTSIYKRSNASEWKYGGVSGKTLSLKGLDTSIISQDFGDVIFDIEVYDEGDPGYDAMVEYLLSEDPYIVRPDIPGGNTKPTNPDPYSGTISPSRPNPTPSNNTPGRPDVPFGVPTETDRPNIFHQAINTGFISLYAPSDSELRSLASVLWSDAFFDNIIKNFQDPMEAILSLGIVPFKVAGYPTVVKIGNWAADGTLGTTRITMPKVQDQYRSIDLGSVVLNEAVGAYLDYSPYTRVSLYLPYIGTVPINADDVMGKEVGVNYVVDLLTGSCVAYILVNGAVHSQYAGNVLTLFPMSGRDMSSIYQSAITIGLSALTAALPGGSGVAAALKSGAMAATANTVMNSKDRVTMGSSIEGTSAILGPQWAYFYIESPNLCLPNNQNYFTGYPSFVTSSLGSLSGYTEVESIHLEGVPCTESELKEIEQLLKEGVML